MPRIVPLFDGFIERARPAIDAATQPPLELSFHLHFVHPSYMDAPMLRLMRSAWQVAEAAAVSVPISRFAILDGSEKCEAEEESRASSWSRANEDVLHLSLAQDNRRCLRVACAANVQTVSQWTRRSHPEAPLHSLPRTTRHGHASLQGLHWETQLFIRLFEKALAASAAFINAKGALESGPEADGMKWQLEVRRGTQLACT
jgi:hypothetical protein